MKKKVVGLRALQKVRLAIGNGLREKLALKEGDTTRVCISNLISVKWLVG